MKASQRHQPGVGPSRVLCERSPTKTSETLIDSGVSKETTSLFRSIMVEIFSSSVFQAGAPIKEVTKSLEENFASQS